MVAGRQIRLLRKTGEQACPFSRSCERPALGRNLSSPKCAKSTRCRGCLGWLGPGRFRSHHARCRHPGNLCTGLGSAIISLAGISFIRSSKLMAALQGAGLSRRRSRRALQAVLRAWKEALERNEPVEVGVGWLVLARVRQRRRLRLKKIVDVPRSPLTGVLLLSRRSPLPPRDRAYRTVVCSLATHPSKRSPHRPLHTLPKTPGQLRTRPRTVANG